MPFTPKALADGSIAGAPTVIFTATANIGTYVKSLAAFNTSAIAQSVRFYVNRTGVDRTWKHCDLDQDEAADLIDDGSSLLLEAGDSILAESTTDGVVDFLLDGVEEAG